MWMEGFPLYNQRLVMVHGFHDLLGQPGCRSPGKKFQRLHASGAGGGDPTLDTDATPIGVVTIGPGCERPYTTHSLFNISGMSYGAISRPAVRALSRGAHLAGCWMNTGEGGLSPYHVEGGADIVFQIGTAKYGVPLRLSP